MAVLRGALTRCNYRTDFAKLIAGRLVGDGPPVSQLNRMLLAGFVVPRRHFELLDVLGGASQFIAKVVVVALRQPCPRSADGMDFPQVPYLRR